MERREFLRYAGILTTGLLLGGPEVYAKTIQHTVRRGDTLSELAVKYGCSINAIRRRNGIRGDKIIIGQKLKIPVKDKHLYISNVVDASRKIKVPRHRWKYIVVHHSGIRNGNAASYNAYHKRRGMKNGLAYHFVIGNGIDSGNGEVEIGPRWTKQLEGGHVKKDIVNKHGIGICLVGNFQKNHPERRQLNALYELIDYLRNDRIPNNVKIAVHKEIDGPKHTVCPGKHFPISTLHKKFPS